MRVRARHVDSSAAPAAVRRYLGQTLVKPGKEYEAHAAAVFEGLVLLQIIDDLGYPGWKPAWLFDAVDSVIPHDWICSTFHEEPSLVLGPDFIARNIESYAAMVELVPEQVEMFWNRIEGRSAAAEEDDSD